MKLNKLLSGPKPLIPLPTFTIVYNKCNICSWWLSLLLLCKQMKDRICICVLCLNYYCYLTICVKTPVFLTVRLRTFFCLASIICWVRFEPAKMPKISSSSPGVHYIVGDKRKKVGNRCCQWYYKTINLSFLSNKNNLLVQYNTLGTKCTKLGGYVQYLKNTLP